MHHKDPILFETFPLPSTSLYRTTIPGKYIDSFGHVNNASYLNIFEDARWEILNKKGMNIDFIQKNKIGPVVTMVSVRYLKELKESDAILVKSTPIGYKNKFIFTMKQEIFLLLDNSEEEKKSSEAYFDFALFDLTHRKILPPNDLWCDVLGLQKSHLEEMSKFVK